LEHGGIDEGTRPFPQKKTTPSELQFVPRKSISLGNTNIFLGEHKYSLKNIIVFFLKNTQFEEHKPFPQRK
jgi:hypothetical protein